jgi:DNA-binding transcriptional regulator YiaG
MYHYKESGLRNVWLVNGYEIESSPYGKTVSIQNISELHRMIAMRLLMKPTRLSGSEIRFLRKEMELSQQSLSQLFGVSAQSVALWEKGRVKVPAPSDRLFRVIVSEYYDGNIKVREIIDHLNEADHERADSKLCFKEGKNGWELKAA